MNKKTEVDTKLLCLTYDTFYHAATAWSGGQDAEGVPGEIPGIRALPRAPHVSDTTSLPFQRADPFGEEKIILFFYFLAVMTHTPLGLGHEVRTCMSSFYENNETIRHSISSADIPREFPAQSSKKCLDCKKKTPPRGPPIGKIQTFPKILNGRLP